MSFELTIDAKSRFAARLIHSVQRQLLAIASRESENGLTQSAISEKLGVNRSRISRLMNGAANLTLRSIAELAWAMGYEVKIEFQKARSAGAAASEPASQPALNVGRRLIASDLPALLNIDMGAFPSSSIQQEPANNNYAPIEVAA